MRSGKRDDGSTAIIVANGNYPRHPLPLSVIEQAPYIVCCDGAANHFIEAGGSPDAIVGDCDSISFENRIRFADRIFPDGEQESNDLTKSVRFCLERGRKNIVIVAGTGLREDHTLGNISLLADYQVEANVKMITDYGIFTPIRSRTTFHSFAGEQVSLFSIDRKPITTTGLKYPIVNRVLDNWWQGTLNESLGDSFTVDSCGKVIVFQVFGC
ncbi:MULTISPECIES: thiamine diphosphokinase [Petrimonas]|jgi:thiamine pyrophosphokinase|uniref:Thiamine diphosphokinase n=1 Tax=Petrimonas mucosa TaxID=1642646 RepID=A0A1G4G7S9_9BACT|nr:MULTISPECIES: thiamine diphosphokinase [Petrimonas]MDD3560150.1 thiamine diphosphokinase [Petrimonas mucosa]SCM58331.1 Thiamine pyrophosphokinase {ECO:0000313/EMBL:CEA16480,1} [Petrimonas mucosa]SFU27825.1 thiamine diphosphokinase [Porphyromonadaceae bacterium KHP3R9]HHT29385.1 thiamine diphosphokinase [Petrimonas mucosa]